MTGIDSASPIRDAGTGRADTGQADPRHADTRRADGERARTPRLSRAGSASRIVFIAVILSAIAPLLHAQPDEVTELRGRLRERYDIAALQDGVGLIPRQGDPRIGIIRIRDGAVAINGEELTGRELRERLGADADLVLRVSYLDAAQQRQLAAPEAPAPAAAGGTPSQPAAGGAPSPQPDSAPVRRVRRQGEVVRLGGDVRVERDEHVENEVVVVFGSAQVDGEVDGDVTVVMGSLSLGADAIVHGDVNVIGGSLNRAATARIDGDIHNVGSGRAGGAPRRMGEIVRNAFVWRVGSLVTTLLRMAMLLLLTLVVVAFGPQAVERIADRTAIDPLRAGLIGFFAELLFFPVVVVTVVVLAVSIVGIPLLLLVPFGILLALLVLLVGFTGVAYQIGRTLHARFGWTGRGAYASVALGVLAIGGTALLARSAALIGGDLFGIPLVALGFVLEYAAWTIGFGAAILVWLRGRRGGLHVPALP
jgi:hypothetical protein